MLRTLITLALSLLLLACAQLSPTTPEPVTPTSSLTPHIEPSPTTPPSTVHRPPSPSPTATPQPFALLFASDREGAGALYLREPDGTLNRLTDPTEAPAWQPDLSPDGEQILFTARRDDQSAIALLPAEGGEIEWLTDHPADDYSPAWSWDGEQVAWVSEREGQGQIWMMGTGANPEPRRLPAPYDERRTRSPAWSPDGSLYFAGITEEGLEELHRYDPETDEVEQLTEWPIKATHPAVSAEGEVVFVGWEENYPWRGLYRLNPNGAPELLWETTDWIGDPAWNADGQWILFTRWTHDGGNHDLWALPTQGGDPRRVTSAPSWEADAALLPTDRGTVPPAADPITVTQPQSGTLALGFNVANLDNAYLSHDLGFEWTKGFASWERTEPERGVFNWIDVDNTVRSAEQNGLKLFLRVDRAPTWARPPDTIGSHPPTDLEAFGIFWETLATRYKGRVAAYELWNEPNLGFEWGFQPPDPALYVEMLRVAHAALERADPDAKLVVGALGVTTEVSDSNLDDLLWMEGFYEALGNTSPRPYDAFSTHPYGLGQPPDVSPEVGLGLRRVEQQRALMERWGDTSPLWLTETGYVRRTPAWDLGEQAPWTIGEQAQADYLVQTLDYVEANYPYVEAVFLFNLDFSTVDWYSAGEQMRAFAILDSSRRPLPAFTALRQHWLSRHQEE